jgi:hypothetical protein
MRYTEIEHLSPGVFKRLTGVRPAVFHLMVETLTVYKRAHRKHPTKGRSPYKISLEDSVLMLLMYYREYRTFLHISMSYGISEMQCWRIITQTEKVLLQSEGFRLLGKKRLQESENHFEVIVVDVAEHPIERPKKNSESITLARKKDTR